MIGFSQGGLENRWALRFWHDTRFLVDDYVSIDTAARHDPTAPLCAAVAGLQSGDRQQAIGSNFLTALNKRHDLPGPVVRHVRATTMSFSRRLTPPESALALGSSSLEHDPGPVGLPQRRPNPISPHIASSPTRSARSSLCARIRAGEGQPDRARCR
jgi:hypothetical protein